MAVGTSQLSPVEASGQAELVKEVLGQAVLQCPHLVQVCQVASHLLEDRDLLIQKMLLQEAAEVGITLSLGQLVLVEQALVDVHLHAEGAFHGPEAPLPIPVVWFGDAGQKNMAAMLILQEHQHLHTGLAVMCLAQEEMLEIPQGHVITVKVEGHRQVHLGSMEQQADMGVDGILTAPVIVLLHV